MKKRKKVTRHRGTTTHGRGAMKKARGKGHRGGVGKAGTGKRADQKKTLILKTHKGKYFGKTIPLAKKPVKKLKTMTLSNIQTKLPTLIKKGIAKESKGVYELNLLGYKIIGNTPIKLKLKIKATSATKAAAEKIKAAQGSLELEYEQEIPKQTKQTKKPEEKPKTKEQPKKEGE